jgi:hypothetical protein
MSVRSTAFKNSSSLDSEPFMDGSLAGKEKPQGRMSPVSPPGFDRVGELAESARTSNSTMSKAGRC